MNAKTGYYDKDMDLCEKIIKEYQKERFERLQRTDFKSGKRLKRGEKELDYTRIIKRDIKDGEKIILFVCEGRFPK